MGTYLVTYSIRADNISDPSKKIATVDVGSTYVDTLQTSIDNLMDVYPANLTSGQDTTINLSIEINATNTNRLMEFRVFQPSNADLSVSDINLSQMER
jgi:hypothetical protein